MLVRVFHNVCTILYKQFTVAHEQNVIVVILCRMSLTF